MLNKQDFDWCFGSGIHVLDGATGTALMDAGMPRSCCQEAWILDHPECIVHLQRSYAKSGSEIIYAPTFQANPLALGRHGLAHRLDEINAQLIALSRSAAPECLIAGNLTTLLGYLDPTDESSLPRMTEAYRRQIHALSQGGADLLAAETLLHPLEAKAILLAAEKEDISAIMLSFVLMPDGTFRSGEKTETVFRELEQAGAAALGVNCIAADDRLPPLILHLRQATSLPLICKPNTGRAVDGTRPIDVGMFTDTMRCCIENGASLIGGCCGTTPEHIAALKQLI